MAWIGKLVRLLFYCGVLGITSLVGFYFYIQDELPTEESIRDVQFQIPMKIYTADGELISQFGEKRRNPLLYTEIPQQLIDAIIATEDARFYEHFGFDPIGIIRAAYVSLIQGRAAQGASTITQQLARNVFLTLDKTLIRKVKELYIALHLEQTLSKKDILTLYLNKIYFGNRAYGIGAAAQVYYDKPINELSLPQLAMIAGLPKAPSNYNPVRNPEKAKWRRNVVLGRMLAVGAIDQAAYQEAIASPVTAKLHGANITAHAPYIAEEVRKEMVERYGKDLAYTGGFKVFTTVDAKTQLAAQRAVYNNIYAYDERHGYRGPTVYLWNEDETDSTQSAASSWSLDKIEQRLVRLKQFNELIPAIVTNTADQTAYIQLKGNQIDVIEWDNLNWAREYISDTKQGPAPKLAEDILQAGAQIWVREMPDGRLRLSQIPTVSSSMVALDPNNGDIKALVGGYNFVGNQYNRVTQAKRQIGSNIKPFLYSAALDNGFTLASLINDAPINKWDRKLGTAWRPKNSPETYDGPTRVRRGLAQSKNVMAVRLMRSLGITKTIEHMTKFGFDKSDLPANESLSLGSASLTPMSAVTAMSAFANGGYLITPNLIDYIEDPSGAKVFQATKYIAREPLESPEELSNNALEVSSIPLATEQFELDAPRIISKENAFLIAEAMSSTVWGGGNWSQGTGWNGTAWRAQSLKRRDIAGKTGTTNKAIDTWFTGFTPQLLATTWVGFDAPGRSLGRTSYNTNLDDGQISGGESGAKTALPGWIDFMAQVLPDIPPTYRDIPEGVVSVRIDRETGLLSRKTDHTTRFEYFLTGTEPNKYAENSAPVYINEEDDFITEDDEIF